MVNFISDRLSDFKTNIRKNIMVNGQGYMWYTTMASLCLITYVLYSYVDNSTIHVKLLYAIGVLITCSSYIVNTLETEHSETKTPTPSS